MVNCRAPPLQNELEQLGVPGLLHIHSMKLRQSLSNAAAESWLAHLLWLQGALVNPGLDSPIAKCPQHLQDTVTCRLALLERLPLDLAICIGAVVTAALSLENLASARQLSGLPLPEVPSTCKALHLAAGCT